MNSIGNGPSQLQSGGQNLHLARDLGRQDQVIVIQSGKILSRDGPNACVAGGRYILIGLFKIGDSPSILRRYRGRIVRGAVINHDNLDIRIFLRQHALYRHPQQLGRL